MLTGHQVQSLKEFCGTGEMGQTLSIATITTDIDTNEKSAITRSVTMVWWCHHCMMMTSHCTVFVSDKMIFGRFVYYENVYNVVELRPCSAHKWRFALPEQRRKMTLSVRFSEAIELSHYKLLSVFCIAMPRNHPKLLWYEFLTLAYTYYIFVVSCNMHYFQSK